MEGMQRDRLYQTGGAGNKAAGYLYGPGSMLNGSGDCESVEEVSNRRPGEQLQDALEADNPKRDANADQQGPATDQQHALPVSQRAELTQPLHLSLRSGRVPPVRSGRRA